MNVAIYIPSMGRHDRIRTLPWIPKNRLGETHIVVPINEVGFYRSTVRDIPVLGCPAQGIGPVRNWIMHDAKRGGYTHVIMMDDDLSFFTRRTDDPTKFLQATAKDMVKCFDHLEDLVWTHAHASILPKQGSNRVTDHVVYNTRLLRVLAYDVKTFHKLGLSFNRVQFMEDFDVTLQLLRAGYPNATVGTHAQDQFGSQTHGGCSIYRTLEGQAEAAHALAALHPGFVEVVQKETKGAWGGGVRTDVRIAWKKALNAGLKGRLS